MKKPVVRRGTAPLKRLRDKLKQLAGRRIWKFIGGNLEKASLNGIDTSLYTSQSAWIKAFNQSGKDLEAFRKSIELKP